MKINAWTLLLMFIVLYFIFQIRQDVLRYNNLVSENQNVEKGLKKIKSNNLDLENKIIALSLDNAIENLARERLNLIKKGESAYKVCRLKSDRK